MFAAKVLQVLIASPSDVQVERDAIEDAIHKWNALNGGPLGIFLLPVRWETHARPGLGDRPQGLINSQLADMCDMLVGCFWTRLGSPTGEAASGTVEEIDRLRRKGAPVLLYFSNQPAVPSTIDTDQLGALTEFKAEIRARGLITEFSDPHDLREHVMTDLTREVRATFLEAEHDQSTAVAPEPATVGSALDQYRQGLQIAIARAKARWSTLRNGHDVEAWRVLADALREELVELQAQLSVFLNNPEAALVSDLELLSSNAADLADHHFYIDGGASASAFQRSMDHLLTNLTTLSQEEWGSYIVSSLPVTADSNQIDELPE